MVNATPQALPGPEEEPSRYILYSTRVSYRIFGWGGGGRNTDSTCVGMHETMFTRKHYTDILDNNILLPSLLCCHMLQVVYYIIA